MALDGVAAALLTGVNVVNVHVHPLCCLASKYRQGQEPMPRLLHAEPGGGVGARQVGGGGGGATDLYMNMGSLEGMALEASTSQLVLMSPLPWMMYCAPTSMWPGPLPPSQRSVGSWAGPPCAPSCSSEDLIGRWLCVGSNSSQVRIHRGCRI